MMQLDLYSFYSVHSITPTSTRLREVFRIFVEFPEYQLYESILLIFICDSDIDISLPCRSHLDRKLHFECHSFHRLWCCRFVNEHTSINEPESENTTQKWLEQLEKFTYNSQGEIVDFYWIESNFHLTFGYLSLKNLINDCFCDRSAAVEVLEWSYS
jgi:hypothetical protein